PLMFRKNADRPHGNDRVGGDGPPARCDVADGSDLFQCCERQPGKSVSRLPQRLEDTDLQRDGLKALRPRKSRGVSLPNPLVVVGSLLPIDHRLGLPPVQRSQSAFSEACCLGTSRRITGASSGNSTLRAPLGRKSKSLLSSVPSAVRVNAYAIVRSGFPPPRSRSRDGRS